MSEPLVLSASSIGTYLRCGYQWYVAYVLRVKRPPTVKQVIGIATHDAVELNYRQKLDTRIDLPVTDVLDAFSDSYDMKSLDVEPDDDEDPAKGKDSGISLVRLYHTEVAPPIQPTHVEQEITFALDDISYSGYLDLADESGIIRDTKTTARTPSDTLTYATALTGYAIGYRQMTGEKESDIVLDFLVRTKTPKYIPIATGQVTDEDIAAFGDVLRQVEAGVQSGTFLPNGLYSNACSWCGYKDICPAFKGASRGPARV